MSVPLPLNGHHVHARVPRTHRRHDRRLGPQAHHNRSYVVPNTFTRDQTSPGHDWPSHINGGGHSLDDLQLPQPVIPPALVRPQTTPLTMPASLQDLQSLTLPRHIAVIMDGNARWAAGKGWPATMGHEAGARAMWECVKNCRMLQIPALTVYAFSSENWHRPAAEVDFLMTLFQRQLDEHVQELHMQGVQVTFIGDRRRLPQSLVARMESAEHLTCEQTGMLLTVAVDYSGREDVGAAVRRIAALAAQGMVDPNKVDINMLEEHLSTAHVCGSVGPPDLLIRTSGEQRLSNFMLYELAYSELFFTQVPWPAFDDQQLAMAVKSFSSRQRRFGRRLPM